MAATTPMARMDQLDKVEKEVVSCLHTAGMALSEVAKDKPSQKQVDLLVTQFMNSLQTIDTDLNDHIKYLSQVSTGQPHEGSSYASQKVLQMAWHRLEHARSRVSELDRIKTQHVSRFISPAQRAALLQQQQQQQGDRGQQQQQQGQGASQ
eukprot:GFUD01039718.1.p2 GENE.GFUD01039718.1~~GFUD01039718.1.p2  ORF type:complete len:151 (+),score=64.02 GFUD01039718.1:54-506(+)